MLRWLLITFLALLLIQWLVPALKRWGFGRLPGDINFTLRGKPVQIPLGSTLVLSLIAAALGRLL
jgi:hypothetical protein